MNNTLQNDYVKVNASLHRSFVFRWGKDYGFFSEYNNMLLAMLYCLKNGYKFTLSSNQSGISETGWTDFFIPFCPETTNAFHLRNNLRYNTVISKKRKFLIKVYQWITGARLTQDFWNQFHSRNFEQEIFDVKSLSIQGDISGALKAMVDITWNFNKQLKAQIEALVNQLNLPEAYIGLHIRRGDKVKETPVIDVNEYMKKAVRLSDSKNIFVATDDYSVIDYLKLSYPDFNFFYLTEPFEKGYDQYSFQIKGETEKRTELIKLFSSIEILSQSVVVVGTYSSNIGMYLGMRIGPQRMFGVDHEKWLIW